MKYYEVSPYLVIDKILEGKEIYVTDRRNGMTRSMNKLSTETTLAIISVSKEESAKPYDGTINRFSFWYRENDESEDESNEYDAVSDVGYGETVTATD